MAPISPEEALGLALWEVVRKPGDPDAAEALDLVPDIIASLGSTARASLASRGYALTPLATLRVQWGEPE